MTIVKVKFPKTGARGVYMLPQGHHAEPGDVVITSYSGETDQVAGVHPESLSAIVTDVVEDHEVTTRPRSLVLGVLSHQHILRNREKAKVYRASLMTKAELEMKLSAMLEAEDQFDRYRQLAQRNPEAKALLARLENKDYIG